MFPSLVLLKMKTKQCTNINSLLWIKPIVLIYFTISLLLLMSMDMSSSHEQWRVLWHSIIGCHENGGQFNWFFFLCFKFFIFNSFTVYVTMITFCENIFQYIINLLSEYYLIVLKDLKLHKSEMCTQKINTLRKMSAWLKHNFEKLW